MNARERKRLRQMGWEAIDARRNLIEAHRISWPKNGKRDGTDKKVFPSEFWNQVRSWNRDIAAWKRLIEKYG